jgi:hypothetical protein
VATGITGGLRRWLFGAGLLLAGICVGVVVQKYYGVGNVLRVATPVAIGGTPSPPPSPTPGRIEVPLSALPSTRVMVALTFGQSNSANFGGTPRAAGPGVYNFANGHLYHAVDPLLGATGDLGSVWTRLGDTIIAAGLYDAVVFIPIGVDNTHIARWTATGDLHPRVLTALDEARGEGLTITHLLWHQGESDNRLKTTRIQYRTMLVQMVTSIRTHDVTAPIYVSVASRCGDAEANGEIEQAQRDVLSIRDGILPGPDTDTLGPAFRLPDGCHFSDEGLAQFAKLWLEVLRAD